MAGAWRTSAALRLSRVLGLRSKAFSTGCVQRATELHYEVKEPQQLKSEVPIVCLHGFVGSASNWRTPGLRFAKELGCRVILPDARNHGRSPHHASMTYTEMAGDVADLMDSLGYDEFSIVGHSMGGKMAMALALTQPERVHKLLVVDAAPVAYGQLRDIHSVLEAMEQFELDGLRNIQEADERLSKLLPSLGLRQFVLQNLRVKGGQGSWRLNLPVALASLGVVSGFPALHGQFLGPTLFIGGSKSQHITPQLSGEILNYFPHAAVEYLSTGHWVHHEAPEDFAKLALDFLAD